MVEAEVDGIPAQPPVKGLDPTEIHRFLGAPDGLADLLSEHDCAKAAQVVDHLAAGLRSAMQIEAVGVIDQLARLCADDEGPGQSSMRNLGHAVAAFVADCLQFVDDDSLEFVAIEFVGSVPLGCGYDFLGNVGAAHGLVRTRQAHEHKGACRLVSDAKAIEHGIEIWRHRAKRAIASGYVVEEGDLFVVLDGLSRFGVGATDAETVAACSDETHPAWAGLRTG